MEDAPDMFDVLWGDAQIMPEVSDSTSSEGRTCWTCYC